jgi:2-polyprenyl-3-methyl-5-hydroxy-6-metoxy-1,4-benzoquinol methylase
MESSVENLKLIQLPACPACGISERKLVVRINSSAVYECSGCTLRYLDPCLDPVSMSAVYESDNQLMRLHDFHEGYYDYGNLNEKSKTADDFKQALKLIEPHVTSKKSERLILDVGCGNGFFLALAREAGWQVEGIDSSRKNAELALSKFSLSVKVGDLNSIENTEKRYDVISFWDVMEHLPNPSQIIQKASRMLKPNGLILVGLPNDRSFLSFLSLGLFRLSFGSIRKGIKMTYFLEHVSYYHLGSLRELFKRNGFSLKSHFFTSTDLAKYKFSFLNRSLAGVILFLGRLFGLQNRLVAVFGQAYSG